MFKRVAVPVVSLLAVCLGYAAGVLALETAPANKPISPVEARKRVGDQVQVQMEVRAAKDRLEKRGEIFLDSEEDFRDEKNFAVVITVKGAGSLKEKGIQVPVEHFQGKEIRVRGLVKQVDDVPRIEVDDADQIKLVENT
jgi:DNA/RNA endonuclease YhcR with UshA esterase domain